MKPIVAIVGRPNVGKSTLFNRLLGKRKAIVKEEPGVTRDLNYWDVEEGGFTFTLVDTGGFEPDVKEGIPARIKELTQLTIESSDIIIFLMDGREGVTPSDKEVVHILRKVAKPIIYTVNKIDSPKQDSYIAEFYSLGVEPIIPISAEHGRNIDELLKDILSIIPKVPLVEAKDERVKIAVVGRPNVGKSTLVNKLLGYERVLVNEAPGTTTDAIDTPFDVGEKRYTLIDTAGIRKKARISRTLERYCVMEAIRSIDRCDVALLVIDAMEGVTGQDERIASLIYNRGKGCIIVVNKWDLVEKGARTTYEYTQWIRGRMRFLAYAPIVFTSALTGQRVSRVIGLVDKVAEGLQRRIPTSRLNQSFRGFIKDHRPPLYKGKEVKIYYITQTSVGPPTFVAFTNYPEGIPPSYERFLVNRIMEGLGLDMVPVKVIFRKKA